MGPFLLDTVAVGVPDGPSSNSKSDLQGGPEGVHIEFAAVGGAGNFEVRFAALVVGL